MNNISSPISNIDACNHIIDLFSPAIDGELGPEESGAFYQHLEACPRCRTEFDRWQDISNRLKTIPDAAVPLDFSKNVMAGIAKTKRKGPGFGGIFTRRGVAAAAAGIMLLAGSMASSGLFNTFSNNPQLAENKQITPAAHQQYKEPAHPTPGADDGTNGPASNGAGGNNIKPEGNSKTIAGNKQTAAGNASGAAQDGGQAGQSNGTVAVSAEALLSEKVVINTRLIKIQSGNTEYVIENANAILGNYKANVQNLVNQTGNSRTTVIMRIITGNQQAGEIAGKLAGLGNILENSAENKDITVQYQQALARQQELAGLLETAEGRDKQNYQNELDALNRQIREWNEAAAGITIMFWVESN